MTSEPRDVDPDAEAPAELIDGEQIRELQAGDLAANPPSASGSALARNSSVMAAGTVTSRVTGVMRDIAMTAALGFYLVSDAYSLGNSLPNIVYILVIGGALNAVFVPQLVRRMKEDSDGGKAYADRLLTLVATSLLVLSMVAVIAAPWIVDLYTPDDYPAAQYELAVAFARLCLPADLLLRPVHDAQPGSQRARTLRRSDVRPYRQQRRGDLDVRAVHRDGGHVGRR